MKHLIETENPSGLAITEYDRLILNSTTNDVIVKGGGYEYVDLGLPSGLKWAKCNVGAEKETDYGDYFMWGSVTSNTADECTWANAPFNGGNTSYSADAFNLVKDTVCPNGILAKEYDAAAQIMGNEWRMPTKAECEELLNNTTNAWVTINGVNGRKFTSKKEGYQNNSIFIPAAGICGKGSVYGVGYSGCVWSSSLFTSDPSDTSDPSYAWDLGFNSGSCDMYGDYRYNGRSVRGVRE